MSLTIHLYFEEKYLIYITSKICFNTFSTVVIFQIHIFYFVESRKVEHLDLFIIWYINCIVFSVIFLCYLFFSSSSSSDSFYNLLLFVFKKKETFYRSLFSIKMIIFFISIYNKRIL